MKLGDFLWSAALVLVIGLFALPATRDVLIAWTRAYPLVMGFSKFALLATMGELLCLRMRAGEWVKPVGLGWRMLVWGVIGAAMALMFQVFNAGAREVMDQGLLPGKGTHCRLW